MQELLIEVADALGPAQSGRAMLLIEPMRDVWVPGHEVRAEVPELAVAQHKDAGVDDIGGMMGSR